MFEPPNSEFRQKEKDGNNGFNQKKNTDLTAVMKKSMTIIFFDGQIAMFDGQIPNYWRQFFHQKWAFSLKDGDLAIEILDLSIKHGYLTTKYVTLARRTYVFNDQKKVIWGHKYSDLPIQ